jgi:hypothetical protein
MIRNSDWERVQAAVRACLEPGDCHPVVFGAAVPRQVVSGHVIASELVPLMWLLNHVAWRYRARVVSRSSGVPLAPRMIMAFTGRRLVIWAARRGWRPGRVIGELPGGQIVHVTASGAGSRSRLMVLQLADGRTVRLHVAADAVTRLSQALAGDIPGPGRAEPEEPVG